MALYSYQAYAKSGGRTTGTIDAPSIAVAREQLARQGLYPIKIAPTSQQAGSFFKNLFKRTVGLREKVFFTKQLAVLLKAGIPLLQALELLAEQSSGKLQTIVITLKDDIKEGRTLADSMKSYPDVFDTTYIQLIKAGEASGKLEHILDRLTAYLERRQELRNKISGALMLPMIQLAVIFLAVAFLLMFVVPNFAQMFENQGRQLPIATRILMGISTLFTRYWYLLLGAVGLVYGSYRFFKSTASGKRMIDKITLKIPVIGYFSRMGAIVQFCRTLGMLMEGGVNLSESLSIVVSIINNQILVDELTKARENIIKEGRITDYLKKTGLFPPLAIYLMHTGEQSGKLDSMLLTIAEQYERDIDEYANNLTTILNPLMLVIMGGVVGFIVMAIMIPMISQVQME